MKKKLVIKLFIFMVVLACAGPFIMKDQEGRPLMTIDRIKIPRCSFQISDLMFWKNNSAPPPKAEREILSPDSIVPGKGQEVVKIYTFKDDQGVSHFTDQEPVRDDYQVIYLPVSKKEKKGGLAKIKDTLTGLTKTSKSSTPATTPETKTGPGFTIPLPGPYSEAGHALEDAKALKTQVEETYKEREKMMNE
ncbi:MAG: hypothetical protein KKD44_20570 [Proteobacteria bacterium]|nr:hypothetical protein [Pseudomonadota bacterium]